MKLRSLIINISIPILLSFNLNFLPNTFSIPGYTAPGQHLSNYDSVSKTKQIAYLDENYSKYSAYILGSSIADAFPIEAIDSYSGKKNYNLSRPEADFYDLLNTAKYIIGHYDVDELFIPISLKDLMQHYSKQRDCFPGKFDIALAKNYARDKRLRDIEYIGSREEYLNNFPVFKDISTKTRPIECIDEFTKIISEIKNISDVKDIKLTLLLTPIFEGVFKNFLKEDVDKLYRELSQITDFWDFTYSSISGDPRYFYDTVHFRKDVGLMMLAKIYDDGNRYIPDDFGYYVQKGVPRIYGGASEDVLKSNYKGDDKSVNVPILLFHHIDEDVNNSMTVSKEKLYEVLLHIDEKGFKTVTYDDLYGFVMHGTEMPDKPLMITFDDGYKSNYDILFPMLKETGQRATIFIIGSSVGKSEYKDTGIKIYEHFSEEEAAEMVKSGLIDIGSHSFDMHQSRILEGNTHFIQESMLRAKGCAKTDYVNSIKRDCEGFNAIYFNINTEEVEQLAYPLGEYDEDLLLILIEQGIKCTYTTVGGTNTVIKGLPQTLYNLKRNNIHENSEIDELI